MSGHEAKSGVLPSEPADVNEAQVVVEVQDVSIEPEAAPQKKSKPAALDTTEEDQPVLDDKEADAENAARTVFMSSPKAKQDSDSAKAYRPHSGSHRQYMRDMILGVNDGLVSMFLLIFGMAGGNLTNSQVLLAGIAGSVAGAISMALGEYLATKSQREVYEGDMNLEKEHFIHHRDRELKEAALFLQELGFRGRQLEDAVRVIDSDDKHLLRLMMAFEFGQNEDDERKPWVAAVTSGALFIGGSLPSWLPFTFTSNVNTNLVVSAVLCGIALYGAGAAKTLMTRGNSFLAGLENLGFGLAGAGLSYLVGYLYQI